MTKAVFNKLVDIVADYGFSEVLLAMAEIAAGGAEVVSGQERKNLYRVSNKLEHLSQEV